MTIFKRLILAACMTASGVSFAADYGWLTFRLADDTELSVASENLSIDYIDDALHLKSATVDETLPVAQIKTMRFTEAPAGITDTAADVSEKAVFYNVSGANAGIFPSVEAGRLNLPSGIYIVKSGDKTFKIIF